MEKRNFIGINTGDHVALAMHQGPIIRGEVMHVSRKHDLIVIRDWKDSDIDHHIHLEDVKAVRDAPRPNGDHPRKPQAEEA